MYTLNWQPPYDWSWMLGFLAARAVNGVETVADSYYARSLAVGEYRGVVTAIPDIARHTLHINLSAGLEPVAAECLAKMSRLFDLQCNPQIVNGALGKLGAARPGLRLPGSVDAFEQGVRAILGQLVSVAMAAKLASRVVALCGEPVADCPGYLCFPTPQALAAADPLALKAIGSVSLKANEPGLRQLAHRCRVPFETFSAEALREHEHRFPASSFVRETVGVGSVSGPVAWLLSQGNLSGETLREQGVTITLGVTH